MEPNDQGKEIVIPEEHQELVDKLGWTPQEYEARIEVLNRDGVTLQELAEWKRTYGEVYRDQFSGKGFYYRQISRSEYNGEVMKANVPYQEREELVCKICTLHPKGFNFANGPAGIANRLMELILDQSGFVTDGPTMSF